MPSLIDTLRRLWQPHRGLFWLMVGLQLLSSCIVMFVQITDPPDALRLVLGLMALTDSLLAWWLTVRLWRESAPTTPTH
jgi:4-hydroxybenzoate polyprenyltransferase